MKKRDMLRLKGRKIKPLHFPLHSAPVGEQPFAFLIDESIVESIVEPARCEPHLQRFFGFCLRFLLLSQPCAAECRRAWEDCPGCQAGEGGKGPSIRVVDPTSTDELGI
jgi:hypothetical protein